MDNSEWVFARAYVKAREAKDRDLMRRIVAAYVEYMDETVEFFERRSVEVLGYEPPQIFLVHANSLNFDHFAKIIGMFRSRGYEFVSLEAALEHKAYRLPDEYVGEAGISWLHRWGLVKDMEIVS